MKLKLKLLTATALFSVATVTSASVYIGASLGYLFDGEEPIFTTQVGFQFGESGSVRFELEGEIGYTESSDSGATVEIVPRMINGRVHFPLAPSVGIYAGGGIGSSYVRGSAFGISISDNVFTAQMMLGLRYQFTDMVSANAGYRYVRLNDVFGVGSIDDSVVEMGIRFSF